MKKNFIVLIFFLIYSGCSQQQPEYFNNIPCETKNCEEEKNGFFWAEKNKIINEKDCEIGFSPSFFNGCKNFTQQKKNDISSQNSFSSAHEKEWLTVKYRKNGKVNISGENFQKLAIINPPIKNAWYDETEKFLLIQLKNTVYQYCNVPIKTWESLQYSKNSYNAYKNNIRGKFDCREFGEVVY